MAISKGVPLRVALVGSESTGKTTLAASLARHFEAPFVPEYARSYVLGRREPLTAADVEPIARGQLAAEDEGRRRGERLVLLDTDLVSTMVYARHYYGTCPRWIEEAARARRADLYLLLHPDVPWVADGNARDQPDARNVINTLFRKALDTLGARTVDVMGTWDEREDEARRAIAALLPGSPPFSPGRRGERPRKARGPGGSPPRDATKRPSPGVRRRGSGSPLRGATPPRGRSGARGKG